MSLRSVELGVAVFCKSRHRADDEYQPLGGHVIDEWPDPDTGEILLRVVEQWRGNIQYHVIPLGDVDAGMSGDLVNTRAVKSLMLALGRAIQRTRDPMAHHHAMTVLAGVLSQHTAV